MPLIRAALRYHIDDGAGVLPVLGAEARCLDAEFLRGIRKREGVICVAQQVLVVGSVEIIGDLIRTQAVHRKGFGVRNVFRSPLPYCKAVSHYDSRSLE